VVCICKGHHKWKHSTNANKAQYDAAVRSLLSEERVKLWDACEKDSWRPVRTSSSDWALELAYLKTLWNARLARIDGKNANALLATDAHERR
jgi:hypothetical protein